MVGELRASLADYLDGVGERRPEAGVIPKINPIQRQSVGVPDFDGLVYSRTHLALFVLIVGAW